MLQRSKSGDSASFAKLSGYVREIAYSYFLSKYHQKKLTNPEDAEDLTQTVYLAFAEQYHSIEQPEKWLRRVLFLSFVRWYKNSKNKSFSQLKENIPAPDKINESADIIDAERVLTVLNTLSDDKQEIVKLRFWGDMKFSEIAEKLNKNEAAVKKMFYRTVLELKEKLE